MDRGLAAVHLDPVGWSGGQFRLRCTGTADAPVTIETSTNLLTWRTLLATNLTGGAIEWSDPESPTSRWRFYRASGSGAPGLQFLAPRDGDIVATARPAIELEFTGGTPDAGNLRLRANGEVLPAQFSVASNRIACLPQADLPEGFVRLSATYLGAVGDPAPHARVKLTVLTSTRNLPPQAAADVANTTAGTPRTIAVLQNDRDPNGDALHVTSAGSAAHGQVSFNPNSVRYVPAPGYVGRDEFAYYVADSQGLTSTGRVYMTVTRAPAVTAYVGSTGVGLAGPGSTFTNLSDALASVCGQLAAGEHGRIVLRSDRPLSVETLSIDCDVEIEAEDGFHPRLEGSAITVNSRLPLLLAGIEFAAGAVQFNVAGDLTLLRSRLAGPTRIQVTAAAAGLMSRSGSPANPPVPPAIPHKVSVAEAVGPALEMIGDHGPRSAIDLRGLDFGQFKLNSGLGQWTQVEFTDSTVGDAQLWARLAAAAEVAAEDNLDFGRLLFDGTLEGDATARLRGVLAGDLELRTRGGSTLTAHADYVRTDRATFNYNSRSGVHEGLNNVHGSLAFRSAGGGVAASTDLRVNENHLRVSGLLDLNFGDNANLYLGLDAGTLQATQVRAGGRFQAQVLNTDLYGRFDFLATGPVAEARLTDARFRSELGFRLSQSTRGGLYFDAGSIDGPAYVQGPANAFPDVHADRVVLNGGTFLAYAIDGPPLLSARSPRLQGAGGNAIRIRNSQFFNTPANSDPIAIHGGRVPVFIENNTIQGGTIGITVSEVVAPVTIRSNILAGCGIAVDGDEEGAGRSGILSQPYLIERNTISGNNLMLGIAVQDLNNVTVRGNRVDAQRALMVSSGRAIAEANTLGNTNVGSMLLLVSSARNGPGVINAINNTFNAGLFSQIAVVLPGGALRFANHTLNGGYITVSGEAEPAFVRFENNNLFMANLAVQGNAHTWLTHNTFTGGFVAITPTGPDSSSLIENTDFIGAAFQLVQSGSATFRQNTFTMGNIGVGGPTAGLLTFYGNTCTSTEVGTGQNGYGRISGNTFVFSSVRDENPTGGLIENPNLNAGLDPETDITTDIDFNGNGCPDYPPGRDERDDQGNCDGPALPVPGAPGVPPPPPWPDFGP
jgi:hypothetical protein